METSRLNSLQTDENLSKNARTLDVSVIIPTRNRPDELRVVLNCILNQTRYPKEVIVVDDSDGSRTENLINENADSFLTKRVVLNYVRNTKERSLTAARNLGTGIAKSEIVLFFDDDVILNSNYIEEILNVYKRHVDAVGVQGYVKINGSSSLTNAISRVFYLSHHAKDTWEILPSGEEIFPAPLSKIINCPRLSGANQSYRRFVFQCFSFDEALKGYGFGEDMDFSFRVFKKYRNGLYVTPYARLVHKESTNSRLPKKSRTCMKTVYNLYFFYKHIPQTFLNKAIFIWSKIGQLTTMLEELLLKRKTKSDRLQILFLIDSYFYALKHCGEIKRGNLTFFNEILMN